MNRCLDILFRALAAVIAVAVSSSCVDFQGEPEEVPAVNEYPVSLDASVGVDSRISVNGLSIGWEDDDKLKITAVASDGSYASSTLSVYGGVDENTPRNASFTGFVSMLQTPQDCYFTYPATTAASVDAASGKVRFMYNTQSGRHEPFLYAKTSYDPDGMDVVLNHVGTMLEFTVEIPGLSLITFAGNDLENIYPVDVDPETGQTSETTDMGVQITVPVQKEGKTYMNVPPVNMSKGFMIVLTKISESNDTTSMVKTFSSDGTLAGGYDFSTKAGTIIPITISGTFEEAEVSASGLSAVHTTTEDGRLTGTKVSFVMSKKGTSNKIIANWGADLMNDKNEVVRTISFEGTPITGESITMNVANDWLLLPQGTYSFRPYYTTIYGEGEKVSLATQLVNIPDPGVTMTLHGNTSYDKYLAGNSTAANVHTNTKIEGVAVSTNLDLSLISKYSADIAGTDLGTGSITTGSESKASYGDLTRTDYRSYVFSAHITCGKLSFSASRTFHITGLPYEVDFNKGSNSSWGTIGNAEYSDSRMTIAYTGDGAICSPAFYLPANTFVNTSVDVSTKSSELLYVQPCVANASVFSKGTASITPHKVGTFGSLKPSTYISCSTALILTSTNCSLMYAATAPFLNNIAIYKVKIEYN